MSVVGALLKSTAAWKVLYRRKRAKSLGRFERRQREQEIGFPAFISSYQRCKFGYSDISAIIDRTKISDAKLSKLHGYPRARLSCRGHLKPLRVQQKGAAAGAVDELWLMGTTREARGCEAVRVPLGPSRSLNPV